MKKRIYSAFSILCASLLMFDFCLSQPAAEPEIRIADASEVVESGSVTAGIIATSAVNLDAIADLSVADSDAVVTAASIGALYGYQNIGVCIVESGNLNVREGASADTKLIGKFPKNAACEIISDEGQWLYIKSGDIEGYVLAEYVVTGADAWALAEQSAQFVATAKTGGLNIRIEPNTDCEVIEQMGNGEEVTVIEELDGWVKVEVDGEVGYVCADYVDVELSLPTAMTLAQARYGAEVSQVRVDLCDYALQFVGNPYVWGGTSLTKGADCSGFVLSIYKKWGVSLPHSSRAQANYGTKISSSDLKPGDLVFYGNGKTIGHVAIYIGGGQIVHASNKRTGIKVSSVWYRTPIKCVRLLQD